MNSEFGESRPNPEDPIDPSQVAGRGKQRLLSRVSASLGRIMDRIDSFFDLPLKPSTLGGAIAGGTLLGLAFENPLAAILGMTVGGLAGEALERRRESRRSRI